ncbi:MAG: tRNA pseudouridine(55) synthase TruB [Huintestinicola sp.]
MSENTELNGIICMYKPVGFTSFDVIAKMRGIMRFKRLGHAGTLDPMAEGVLPVFCGRATKACEMLPDHDKIYEAEFRLGTVTDTQDSTGQVTSDFTDTEAYRTVTAEAVGTALEAFRGDIMQVPPMYSAVSVGGKRLYELARQGKTVERQARPITIYELELLSFDETEKCGRLRISCSKGTYIRTLINDIGEKLGTGGIMTALKRTSACGFSIESCVTLDQLQLLADRGEGFEGVVLPIESVFGYLPKLRLGEAQERMYRNGIRLDLNRLKLPDSTSEVFAVYGQNGFIGTALADREKMQLRVGKNF